MRVHLPILRSRSGRPILAAVALAIAFGAAAAGWVLTRDGNAGLAEASFPGYGLSFSYPAGWKRNDWCWIGNNVFPLTLLTRAPAAPPCRSSTLFGNGTPLPPPQRLGSDDVAAWWLAADRSGSSRFTPNSTVGGRPARVTVRTESTRRTSHSYVNCRTGKTQRFLVAQIRGPSSTVDEVQAGAVICGPDFAAGEAEVRRMLASVRFEG